MRLLSTTSWRIIVLVAAVWILAWLVAAASAMLVGVHNLSGAQFGPSGGPAALGVGLTTRGAVVVLGPPLVLLALRLVAARITAR